MAKALFVLTSHAALGATGRQTGWFLEEAATPYVILTDAGFTVDVASIAGGAAPIDPASMPEDGEGHGFVARFLADSEARAKIEATIPIADVDEHAYDLVFLPGGHGTMWDFPVCEPLSRVIQTVWYTGGVVGAVCHGPAGLVNVKGRDGRAMIADLRVTGFSNAEEGQVGLAEVVPFLLADALAAAGAEVTNGEPFREYVVRDGLLVTGQNPMSSEGVARAMVEAAYAARRL